MAGGNWDPVQNITSGRVDFSTGPLDLTGLPGNPTPRWVDAWIVQSSTGSAQTYYGSKGSGAFAVAGHWIANVRLYNRGTFLPGPAVGIALVYWKDTNSSSKGYLWWSEDPIELQ
jgi:hypothetical protein